MFIMIIEQHNDIAMFVKEFISKNISDTIIPDAKLDNVYCGDTVLSENKKKPPTKKNPFKNNP